jgi:KaiC/GvpD/RAD55 family RecA-like ATPase
LGVGDSVLVIATAEHREHLLKQLQNCGVDVRLHARQGRYVMLDTSETLATFMRDGMPDAKLFRTTAVGILDEARRSARSQAKRLTVFGEMVAVLWDQGNHAAALQLEALWNETLNDRVFHLHCAYPRQSVLSDAHMSAICGAHSHLVQ